MPSGTNKAIIAAAGARKTQYIIDAALADPSARALITTYTNENLRQIQARIQQRMGVIPPHIQTAGWFSFLLSHGIRPYQRSMLGRAGIVGGLNFPGKRNRYTPATDLRYFVDSHGDVYRDGAADLVDRIDGASGGLTTDRLERIFDHIYIDEVQDLVGWDLEVLERLFSSNIGITVVGDPRQHTYGTNVGTKNKKYRGAGLVDWLDERAETCEQEHRNESHRCQQEICDFASDIFPEFEPLTSGHTIETDHDGVHMISPMEVQAYYEEHRPQVLRWNKRIDTFGLPALNIGVSKGSTYDRVLIVPTKPIRKYLQDRDHTALKSREMLYVAVTRARHSVAFVL
jgi:DNA helicase-2/ATP-dependent DNA helicase PcrA